MLRIAQLKMSPNHDQKDLVIKICKVLRIPKEELREYHIVKKSIDARHKPEVFYSYIIDCKLKNRKEAEVCRYVNNNQLSIVEEKKYQFPYKINMEEKTRPIIIGTGPAGLFCGYVLAKAGFKPILLERGEKVEDRTLTVETFWETGVLNENSNVQFGEGGAGTFSDGKLNSLVKDKDGRNKEVLRIFVENGAPEQILYENKPHLGTDLLIDIVSNMRKVMMENGAEVHFNSEVTDFEIVDSQIKSILVNGTKKYTSDHFVLAIGHSARNTFEKLLERKVPMEAKAFAVGLRVMHPQKMINYAQYAMDDIEALPVASYKLAATAKNQRGVYSFCMCPGGFVIDASSEKGRLACNGMSYHKRDSGTANSAIIVSVSPEDFGEDNPLNGIYFQRELEEKAYNLADGKVPVQYYKDFKSSCGMKSTDIDSVANREMKPLIKGNFEFVDLHTILPDHIKEAFIDGMEQFNGVIKGFAKDDTILVGVESRTSSPVRILRNEFFESAIVGIYPCGEGAGYAGGITSAAMDGIKVAEAVAKSIVKLK